MTDLVAPTAVPLIIEQHEQRDGMPKADQSPVRGANSLCHCYIAFDTCVPVARCAALYNVPCAWLLCQFDHLHSVLLLQGLRVLHVSVHSQCCKYVLGATPSKCTMCCSFFNPCASTACIMFTAASCLLYGVPSADIAMNCVALYFTMLP